MEEEPQETSTADVSSKFVARFQTTKHSWKGKYKRIFSIGYEWYEFIIYYFFSKNSLF